MTISVKTRKVLWSRSGNICAFPGCRQELTETVSSYSSEIVIGEEAHIVAIMPDGPRGLAMLQLTGLDSYENLILLCPTHHSIVDAQPQIYTVESLLDMKRAHEMRIRALTRADECIQKFALAGYDHICSGLRPVNAWRLGPSLVVACSFGSDPVIIGEGRWLGSGLQFQHIYDGKGSETLVTSSEAEFDIEYWMAGESLCVIQQTYEPESQCIVPLLQRTFDLRIYPASTSTKIVLEPPEGSLYALPEVLEILRSRRLSPYENIEVSLFRLRNAGLKDPDQAIRGLASLRGLWWYDGAGAETAESVMRELELVKSTGSKVF